jgi:hypothetical protein
MVVRATPTRLYYDWEGARIHFDRGEGNVLTVKPGYIRNRLVSLGKID